MIRTVDEYLESLRDGRVIYCLGKKVKDVTTHPILRRVIFTAAMDYIFPHDPNYRDLFVAKDEDGEDTNFMFLSPKSSDDLLRRREIFVTATRTGGGVELHRMGVDALAAAAIAATNMDNKLGTDYRERVENYRKYLQKNDLGVTGAMTDAKGDRGLHPSKQQQHQDFYVRVVDRQKDGIVVRGAKTHISATPGANEAIVLPCRTHGEEDKDYAVVFATPLNAKGIILISSEPVSTETEEAAIWDCPATGALEVSECTIVFDDVFVPWERVFMCGEWEFSQDVVYGFALFHRLFGVSRMVSQLELLTGVTALMAEYNGVEKYSHIREKLSWLATYTEAVSVIGRAACVNCDHVEGTDLVTPSMLYTNVAKFMFADNYHQACKIAQDICGGIVSTAHAYRDWNNPEVRPWLEKYFEGKAGTSAEHRLRAARLIKNLSVPYVQGGIIHGEGSLAAQKIFMYASADWNRYKASAKKAIRAPGWEKETTFNSLPDYPACVISKFPPVDTFYKL